LVLSNCAFDMGIFCSSFITTSKGAGGVAMIVLDWFVLLLVEFGTFMLLFELFSEILQREDRKTDRERVERSGLISKQVGGRTASPGLSEYLCLSHPPSEYVSVSRSLCCRSKPRTGKQAVVSAASCSIYTSSEERGVMWYLRYQKKEGKRLILMSASSPSEPNRTGTPSSYEGT
jgi:hypothetical protein